LAKKSKSELAAEGKTIKALLGVAKNARLNFALFVGPDGLIFHADKVKGPGQLKKLCKAEKSTNKGAMGGLDVKGTLIDLVVDDPTDTPPNFAKSFKTFLKERNLTYKVQILSAEGALIDGAADEPDEASAPAPADAKDGPAVDPVSEEPPPLMAGVEQAFAALRADISEALQSGTVEDKKRIAAAVKNYQTAIKGNDLKLGDSAIAELKQCITDVAAPDPVAEKLAALAKVLKAITPSLKSSLKTAPAEYKKKLATSVQTYQAAITGKETESATAELIKLRKLVASTPSATRVSEEMAAAGDDPEKLAKLDGIAQSCAARVKSEPAFLDTAYPELRDMRTALKDAMAKVPPPANIAALLKMKEDMDAMFYDHVDKPPRSHGPEFHGPGLTVANLEDRVMNNNNPRSGGRAHGNPTFSASNFKDKGDYVDTQMALRTKALAHIKSSGMTKGRRPQRLPAMEGKLQDVLGAGWESAVQGVKKKTRRNRPAECVAANWGPDSICVAFYDLMPDGSLRLVTLYPKAVAPVPPPTPPRTAAPRARRNRRGGGGSQN
jgi:hypothetical protein